MNSENQPPAFLYGVKNCLTVAKEKGWLNTTPLLTPTTVRWLIRCDLAEVVAIESATYKDPWTESDFLKVLKIRNVIGMVAERGDKIVGYMIYELNKNHIRLLNLAVLPILKNTGVGGSLLDKLKSKLDPKRCTRIVAMVRESNLPTQLYFKAHGFRATQVIRGYYDTEDGCKMVFAITPDKPAAPAPR